MANGKKSGLIWVVVIGVLGVCCLSAAGVGAFFMLTRQDAVVGGPTAAMPAGFIPYTQSTDCTPYNPSLALTGFTIQHPATDTIELCTQQGPQAYNYVTFYQTDAAGALTGQFGVGFVQGIPDPTLIDQLVENLRMQMPAGTAFTLLDATPYMARSQALTRKDYQFDLTGPLGNLAPGQYAFRVVLIPDDRTAGVGGLTLILIQRATLGVTAALTTMEGDYRASIESIHF